MRGYEIDERKMKLTLLYIKDRKQYLFCGILSNYRAFVMDGPKS